MSKIKIFALGGLNEDGKNMYIVEKDNDIFIFDAGLKYGTSGMLGVDYIIPDFKYIKENQSKIKGIFLSHGHDEAIGAVPEIIKEIPNIKVYGTKFTLEVLKRDLVQENLKTDNLITIVPHQKISFGEDSIFPLAITHSIPEAVMYVLNTKDGSIVYTGDFTFDNEAKGSYKADIGKIAYVGKQGVLCLLSQSLYSEKKGHTSPNHRIKGVIKEALHKNKGRFIFNVTSTQVYRIQELFDEVAKTDRKIVIMGKRSEEIITKSIDEKYMSLNKNKIGTLKNLNDDNVVVLVSDERDTPFLNLSRIVTGGDKFLRIKESDTVMFGEPTKEGLEKVITKLANDIAKRGANVIELSPKKYLAHNASREDLILMMNLLKPKYYIPVIGDYRFQYQNAELAIKTGINKNNVLLKLNGEKIIFENGKLSKETEFYKTDELLIDGKIGSDVGEIVIKDREMLSSNGIVVVTAAIDRKTKKIISGPNIITKGFVYDKKQGDLIKSAEEKTKEVINKHTLNNKIEFNKIKNDTRDVLSKYLYSKTKCKPMILTVIQEI